MDSRVQKLAQSGRWHIIQIKKGQLISPSHFVEQHPKMFFIRGEEG
jgi:hypothetical protein